MRIPIEFSDRRTRPGQPKYRSPAFSRNPGWNDPYGIRADAGVVDRKHDLKPESAWEEVEALPGNGTRRYRLKQEAAGNPNRKNGDYGTPGNNGRGSTVKIEKNTTGNVDAHDFATQRPAYAETLHDKEEAQNWKNRYQRLLADFENQKRHAEAERKRLSGIGKEAVLDDIFPITDHLERAIRSVKEAGEDNGILEGIEMVYTEFLKALKKHGVTKVDTVGIPFDPKVHEAVAVTEHPAYPEDTVVEEVRNGFTREERLLRPAHVVVARVPDRT